MKKVVLQSRELINVDELDTGSFIGVVYRSGLRGVVIRFGSTSWGSQPISHRPLNLGSCAEYRSLRDLFGNFEGDIRGAYVFDDAKSLYNWALEN